MLVSFTKRIKQINGCWVWQTNYVHRNKPYGRIWWRGKYRLAHVVMWEEFGGCPKGDRVIDHLCNDHRCVNPFHLRLLTHRENILRGVGVCAEHARKTQCPQGHEYRQRAGGTRYCPLCKVTRQRERRRRAAEEGK